MLARARELAWLLLTACGSDSTHTTTLPDAAAPIVCAVPAGADPRVHAITATHGRRCTRIPAPLGAPRDVVETRDHTIYVSEMSAGRISRLDGDHFVPAAEGLLGPIGLREGPEGSLVVGEEGGQRVSQIDRATGARSTLADRLGNVTYVATSADGTVYASAFSDLMTPTGVVHRIAGGMHSVFAMDLVVPEGLALDGAGNLLVVEWGATSHASALAPSRASIATGFVHLYGIAVSPLDGAIYLADVGGNRVTMVGPSGALDDVLLDVAAPAGLWVAGNGDLLIAEHVDGDRHDATGYLIRISK